jgi:hypothetical protein
VDGEHKNMSPYQFVNEVNCKLYMEGYIMNIHSYLSVSINKNLLFHKNIAQSHGIFHIFKLDTSKRKSISEVREKFSMLGVLQTSFLVLLREILIDELFDCVENPSKQIREKRSS